MTSTPLSIFLDDLDNVFASPNADHIPAIPDLRSRFWADRDPIDCLKIKFDQNEYPYIGFVPVNLRCKGVIFGRLDLSQYPTLIECVPGKARWRTVPNVATMWSRLEEALIMMTSIVSDKSGELYVHLDYKLPPFPSTYGYLRDHASSRFAMKAVRRSRSAFLLLIAWCLSACASSGKIHSPKPGWYKILEESGWVHQEWLNEMARNEIADFSGNVKRVGMFVHLGRCPWLTRIRVYINANVPIWFYWGNIKVGYMKTSDEWVQGYKPSPAAITEAVCKRQQLRLEVAKQPDESQDNHPPVEAQDLAPPPTKLSHQRRGEHWRDFFARIEKNQNLVATQETPDQLQSRLDRERHQARHPFPGKRGLLAGGGSLSTAFASALR
jgi:hypothetical protein